jgi:hypothetical protein
VNCVRKPKAEDYPKNFALLKLAEKTLAKVKQNEALREPQDIQTVQPRKSVVEAEHTPDIP